MRCSYDHDNSQSRSHDSRCFHSHSLTHSSLTTLARSPLAFRLTCAPSRTLTLTHSSLTHSRTAHDTPRDSRTTHSTRHHHEHAHATRTTRARWRCGWWVGGVERRRCRASRASKRSSATQDRQANHGHQDRFHRRQRRMGKRHNRRRDKEKKIASDTDMCRRTGPLCPAAAILGCVLCVCSSRSLLAFYA